MLGGGKHLLFGKAQNMVCIMPETAFLCEIKTAGSENYKMSGSEGIESRRMASVLQEENVRLRESM